MSTLRFADSCHVYFVQSHLTFIQGMHRASLQKQLDNIECMVLSYVKITDHFYKKMVEKKLVGAIFMTSSQVCFPALRTVPYGFVGCFLPVST